MTHSLEITTALQLVRIGLGIGSPENYHLPSGLDWEKIISFSRRQGLSGVMADGMGMIPVENMPGRRVIMKIMGSAGRYEKKYDQKLLAVSPLANVWHKSGIRIALLKGMAFARYYPNVKHRYSSDVDVFLFEEKHHDNDTFHYDTLHYDNRPSGRVSAYERGNEIARECGLNVDAEIQKHSQIGIQGVTIENHCKCCGQLEHKPIAALEDYLESMLFGDEITLMEGTHFELPPLMFDALFFIYHSRVHFVIEGGILLRHVLDWVMIRKEIVRDGKVNEVKELCERFGMMKFYQAIDGVADYVEGKQEYDALSESQRLMLDDILNALAPKKKADEKPRSMFVRRWSMLVEIYNSRRKYPLYSDVSFVKMMWIYVRGYLRRVRKWLRRGKEN